MKRFITWLFPVHNLKILTKIGNIIFVLINLLPLVGVLFFNWEAFPILLLYFFESTITLLFGYIRLIQAPQIPEKDSSGDIAIKIFGIALFLCIFLSLQGYILSEIFLATGLDQNWHSLINIFGLTTVSVFFGYQIIYNVLHYRKIVGKQIDKQLGNSYLTQLFIFLMIFATHSSELALIILILLKIFLEIRSILRRQAGSEKGPIAAYS